MRVLGLALMLEQLHRVAPVLKLSESDRVQNRLRIYALDGFHQAWNTPGLIDVSMTGPYIKKALVVHGSSIAYSAGKSSQKERGCQCFAIRCRASIITVGASPLF